MRTTFPPPQSRQPPFAWHFAIAVGFACATASATSAPKIDSIRDIAPIFEQHCLSCHKSSDPNGDLDLTRSEGVFNADEKPPVIVPKEPVESLLLKMISGDQPEMPQDAAPLTDEQVSDIRHWIEEGATWPADTLLQDKKAADTEWWSLKPLKKPKLPQLDEPDSLWVRTPVDTFVLAMLREQQLSPAAEADRRTLLRRLHFDLIGLPPTSEEFVSFENASDPQAYENLVERLLASDRYGERWARHWLDVVHYGDPHGYQVQRPRSSHLHASHRFYPARFSQHGCVAQLWHGERGRRPPDIYCASRPTGFSTQWPPVLPH